MPDLFLSILNCLLLTFIFTVPVGILPGDLSPPNLYRFGFWRKTPNSDEETQTHTVRLCTGLYFIATDIENSAVVTAS
jgi:hypothetical protein